jgi:hypothetical protein
MLKGKKAYIVSILGMVVSGGNVVLKFLNGEPISIEDIMAIFGSAGLGALRAGIKNG